MSIAALAVTASAQELCTSCHGQEGNSPDPEVPSIAAQPKLFLENQLVVFREGLRPSPQMAPIVQGMPDAEITRLATHFSRLPSKAMDTGGDRKLSAHGRSRAAALRCGVCHLPDFRGQKQVPRLASQRERYLAAEMKAYRDGRRQGGDTIMSAALHGVSDEDIAAIAHFLSRQR